jgi:hypothetical protein
MSQKPEKGSKIVKKVTKVGLFKRLRRDFLKNPTQSCKYLLYIGLWLAESYS